MFVKFLKINYHNLFIIRAWYNNTNRSPGYTKKAVNILRTSENVVQREIICMYDYEWLLENK